MALECIKNPSKISVVFKITDPLKLQDYTNILDSMGPCEKEKAIAVAENNEQSEMFLARSPNYDIVYLPQKKVITLSGSELNATFSQFDTFIEKLKGSYNVEKWNRDISFFEVDSRYELELNNRSALDVMEELTKNQDGNGLKKIFEQESSTNYILRNIAWVGENPKNLKAALPLFDVGLWPNVENTDRFSAQIICRNGSYDDLKEKVFDIEKKLFSFVDNLDKE